MIEKIKSILDFCDDFIENATKEELLAYEKSLNLDYGRYLDDGDFVNFVELGCSIFMQDEKKYSCAARNKPVDSSKSRLSGNFVVAA